MANEFICKPFHESEIFEALNKHCGVEFMYLESKTHGKILKSKTIFEFRCETSDLSEDLRQELYNSALNVDLTGLKAGLTKIEEKNPRLFRQLTDLAERYEYEKLLQILEKKEDVA